MRVAITLTFILLITCNSGCLQLAMWGASELIEDQRERKHQAEKMAELNAIRRNLLQYQEAGTKRDQFHSTYGNPGSAYPFGFSASIEGGAGDQN